MGAPGASRAPDEIGGPRGTLFRDGCAGRAGRGARRRVDYPHATEARESRHRITRRERGAGQPHPLSARESQFRGRGTPRCCRPQRTRQILAPQSHSAGTARRERGLEIGARTQINYVDQNRLLLDDEKTVWEEVGSGGEHVTLGEQSITLRAYLRRFLFSEERINTKISQLSGGERR